MLFAKGPHIFYRRNGPVAAGDHGNIGPFRLDAGIHLVTEHDQVFHPGTDKDEPFFRTAFGQVRILRKEPVTGMDGVYIVLVGNTHNIFNIQIGFHRALAPAYQIRFIGFVAMQGQRVFFGKNRNGANAQLIAGAEDANRNLAPVGN